MRASARFGLSAGMLAAVVLLLASCGGKSQDANEPSGNFKVQVLRATFPGEQKLAKRSRMVIVIKNVDNRELPNPSITVKSFNRTSTASNLADPSRPVFVVNTGPVGGDTANQETSAFGKPLAPGKTARFVWNVTAVRAGPYRIHWEVSAGLFGKARAVDSAGNTPTGTFSGKISNAAPHSKVNFKNGRTVEGG